MKSAPVLETALAVGAYAEENRMGGGARGQEKKKRRSRPRLRASDRGDWNQARGGCARVWNSYSVPRVEISPSLYIYIYSTCALRIRNCLKP